MKKLILSVLSIELFAQPDARGNVAAIITKVGANNPSANGVHTVNEGQLRRIVTRCIGFYSPIGLKHIVKACGGAVKLMIDAEECKEGETFTKRNGETGTYTKNWTKYSNHEVELGMLGSMKLAELSLSAGFQEIAQSAGTVVAPARKAVVAGTEDNESEGETSKDETATV